MPYVHLANGDVHKLTTDELVKSQEESGTANAYRKDGMEHTVIGVYPDEVEHEPSAEKKSENAKKEAEEKKAFDEWRASQHNFEGNPL